MYPVPTDVDYQQQKDTDQIKLLSIFHFVFGVLAIAGIGFLVMHYYFMNMIFNEPQMWQQMGGNPMPAGNPFPGNNPFPGDNPFPADNPFPGNQPFPNGNPFPGNQPFPGGNPAKQFFGFFKIIYFVMGGVFVLVGLASILSGIYLRQRKHRMFSIIVAGISCLQIPFGTALGICTILVLQRDSVKQSYGEY